MKTNHYNQMITPGDTVIVEFSRLIGKCRNGVLCVEKVTSLMRNMFTFDNGTTGFSPFELIIRLKRGNCLSLSSFLCSVLRLNGFGTDNVFVMVGGNPIFYRESAHAWTIVKVDDAPLIVIDPRRLFLETVDIIRNKKIYLLFNDEKFIVGIQQRIESII